MDGQHRRGGVNEQNELNKSQSSLDEFTEIERMKENSTKAIRMNSHVY